MGTTPSKFILTAILIATLAHPTAALSFCFEEAAAEYGVAPQLLWAISKRESGHQPDAINRNTNGSYDYCHMQINSSWYAKLGEDRWNALSDPCQCTKTGAWILSQCVKKYGYTWKAVGCYHSQTPDKRDRYAALIANTITSAKYPQTVAIRQPESSPDTTTSLAKIVWGNNDNDSATP
jgi:soluble lytic murein transglycosylase-like protein